MRIIFAGTPELAVPILEAIVREHEIVAVLCQPDKPQGRSAKLVAPPVKQAALALGLPVHQPTRLNDGGFERWLLDLDVDVGVIVAYGRILKQPILDAPKHGWLNMHPSLLPRWRGPSPIQTAVLKGDTQTGVTIMRIDAEMDAGDILLQRPVEVGADEDAVELTARLVPLGAEMMVEGLRLLESGQAQFTPQAHDAATYCNLLSKHDGEIQWSRPAREIHNQIRGCVPWPIAHTKIRGDIYRIHKAEFLADDSGTRGEVLRVEKERIVVAAGEGAVAITHLQAPGKRAMSVREYLAGHAITPGERFEDMS